MLLECMRKPEFPQKRPQTETVVLERKSPDHHFAEQSLCTASLRILEPKINVHTKKKLIKFNYISI